MAQFKKYFNNINMLFVLSLVFWGGIYTPQAEAETIFRPYLYNGTDGHMSNRIQASAPLSDWTTTPGEALRLVRNFRAVDVLDDYSYNVLTKSPLLTVGPGFYRLSRVDQNRVAALVDYVYNGTQKKPGTIFISDRDTGRVIGLYTVSGLQLE